VPGKFAGENDEISGRPSRKAVLVAGWGVANVEEVHLWRGTPEQRALRYSCRKSGQFAYFDQQFGHPNWRGRTVLDFGGNQGNLLTDPTCKILAQNYHCLDVIKDAVEEGRQQFPQANWMHYNRYNCSFNPDGFADLPIPKMGIDFEFILAFSVFTHTTREEMHDLVAQLRSCLAPNGRLAFTFIDPHYSSRPETYEGTNLQWRLDGVRESNRSADLTGLLEKSRGADWCALVDGTQLHVNGNGIDRRQDVMTYHVFYTVACMQREFPDATILPPVNGEMHHCCIMQRTTSLS
jgi:SAM-dependent methyltransferase